MESKRQQKFSRLIQRELADIFQREVQHLFGSAYITVSMVRVSPDLGLARVYLSVMMAQNNEAVLLEVRTNTRTIRHLLAQRIKNQVRVIPELNFYLDDSAAYAAQMDEIFNKLDIPPADENNGVDDETYPN